MKLNGHKIAVIGDVHGKWNDLDNAYFDRSDYDLLIFVGDLGSGTLQNGLSIIRQLARLRVPALVLPGNNDARHLAQLDAELAHQSGKLEIFRLFGKTMRKLIQPCGFSVHELATSGGDVSLIAARPCAMGGSEFSFPDQLRRNHGVRSLEESSERLRVLVDRAESQDLLFIAHNGPEGLGPEPGDLWGRDFVIAEDAMDEAPRDWGDRDLREAIEYAKEQGKRVLGVLAGHMHRRPDTQQRPFAVERDGIVYVNVAVVPRIFSGNEGPRHHHVELQLDPLGATSRLRLNLKEHVLTLPCAGQG